MKTLLPIRMQCGLLALSIVFLPHLARAATTIVQVGPNNGRTFVPQIVTIQPGDTVEWDWASPNHSVTSGTPGNPDGIFDSGVQNPPFTFTHTFATSGSFPYYCTTHAFMMTGTVNVVAEAPTPTPTPTDTPAPTVTPTPTPSPTSTPALVNISGTISYCSAPSPGPVSNVTLNLTGDATASTLSDGSGNYSFLALVSGGSYTVTPSKPDRAPGSPGINTLDVIAVQRHFLGSVIIPPGCRLTAANVSPPATINTLDVIAIQHFFLGQSVGIQNTGKYKFSPVNRSYSPLGSDQTSQNFDALILGDVAGPFVSPPRPGGPAPDAAGSDSSSSALPSTVAAVALPKVAVTQSTTDFIAAVTTTAIDAKDNLVGFQGDLTFDERVVNFQSEPVQPAGLTAGNWNVSGNVLDGPGPIRTLRISAYSNDLTPLSRTGTLFELRMTRVGKANQSTQLIWAAPPDDFIFIDADLNMQRPGRAVPGSVRPSSRQR